MLNFLSYWNGEGIACRRGSDLSSWLIPFPCQAYTGWYSHTSAYAEACTEVGVGQHGWAFAGLFSAVCGDSI